MCFCACLVSNVYSYVILPEHFKVPDVFFRKRIWIRKLPSLGASVNPSMTFAHSTWDQCYRPTICLGKWVSTAGCCLFPLARSDPELSRWPPSLSGPQILKLHQGREMETPALLWQLPSCCNQVWVCLLVFLIHLAGRVSLSAIGGARDHSDSLFWAQSPHLWNGSSLLQPYLSISHLPCQQSELFCITCE